MARLRAKTALLLFAAASAIAASPACTGNIGDAPAGGVTGPSTPGSEAQSFPAPTLRKLVARQYRNAVRDLLGVDAALAAAPPADAPMNGFESIGAAQFALGDTEVRQYEESARAVAAAGMGNPASIAALADCSPTSPPEAETCQRVFVERFGRLAWRRPLDKEEIDLYAAVAKKAAEELNDFYAGIEYATAALLQSPNFLYQVELGEPDLQVPGARKLTGYEMASRISFFLLDTTPDEALLTAAEAGKLATAEGVREAARALLGTPAAREALRGFYDEFLRLRDLPKLVKDGEFYPQFSPSLAQAMQEETLALIDDVVWERNADYRDVLDADYTFVNAELAAFYGLPTPEEEGFSRVVLPPEQKRGGIFGHAGFLSLFAHATSTSPTLRGRFVRERMLCQSIPAPPNNVVTELPSDAEAKTMRDKLAAHQKDPSCSGCHKLMDNIGFGLENYDGIGVFRTMENGVTIDTKSDVDGVVFDGAKELGSALRNDDDVSMCVVRNIFRFATGHVETKGEKVAMEALGQAFADSGYKLQDLLVEVVASDAFRLVGTPK